MSSSSISLDNFKTILVAHERDYHSSRGTACQEVLDEIIEEINFQGKEKSKSGPNTVKKLEQVSQLFYP